MHLLDYIVVSIILIWLISAVCYIIRQKKLGRSVSCGGSCANCAGCQKCTSQTVGAKRNENP